jgi:hypothetical protein
MFLARTIGQEFCMKDVKLHFQYNLEDGMCSMTYKNKKYMGISIAVILAQLCLDLRHSNQVNITMTC